MIPRPGSGEWDRAYAPEIERQPERVQIVNLTAPTLPLTDLPTIPAWMADARCRTSPFDFMKSNSGRGAYWEAKKRIDVCEQCPVRVECRWFADWWQVDRGVWGGVWFRSDDER